MNAMVVNPDLPLLLHPLKMSRSTTLGIWQRWFTNAGPCPEMLAIEQVLTSSQSGSQHLLTRVLDIVAPPDIAPMPFRSPCEDPTPSSVHLFSRDRHRLQEPLPKLCQGAKLWAVLTTINAVGEGIRRLDKLPDGWCVLVVADKKTPKINGTYFANSNRVFYLSPEEQMLLPFKAMRHIPWNHFSRKNVGFLVAAALGAEAIYDTDDDNILFDSSLPSLLHREGKMIKVRQLTSSDGAVRSANIYTPFANHSSAADVWPRGTPLRIPAQGPREAGTLHLVEVDSATVAIEQSLVNGDPDVDAIYRMGPGIPEDGIIFAADESPLMLGAGVAAPINSQATSFKQHVFPLLLLPASVHPRVSDIWRGYFALPILWSRNLHVVYVSPKVKQVRNEHDEKEDLWAEWPLYHKSDSLVADVVSAAPGAPRAKAAEADSIEEAAVQLYSDMYQKGIIQASDVELCKAFMEDMNGARIDATYQ